MRFLALAVLCIAIPVSAQQEAPGKAPDACLRSHGDAQCKLPNGKEGKCEWLTRDERITLEVKTRARCEKGKDGKMRCLSCVSEAYRPEHSRKP